MPEESSQVGVPDEASAWAIYNVVAARRLQWDNLLWQVPALSIAAQAFLMTIALSSSYETWPRRAAALLAVGMSLMSLNLLARQRLSEVIDAHFLAAFEKNFARWLPHLVIEGEENYPIEAVHGIEFKQRRDRLRGQRNDWRGMAWAAYLPSGKVWFVGLALFGAVAFLCFLGSFFGWAWIFAPSQGPEPLECVGNLSAEARIELAFRCFP